MQEEACRLDVNAQDYARNEADNPFTARYEVMLAQASLVFVVTVMLDRFARATSFISVC